MVLEKHFIFDLTEREEQDILIEGELKVASSFTLPLFFVKMFWEKYIKYSKHRVWCRLSYEREREMIIIVY